MEVYEEQRERSSCQFIVVETVVFNTLSRYWAESLLA